MTVRNGYIASAAVGALAAVLATAGGLVAHAGAQPADAVGATAALGGPPGAPLSFADIVEKVAPAVVSIDVESRPSRDQVALAGPGLNGQETPFGFRFPQPPDGAQAQPVRATGSGFFISADGYVVTNNHVVDGADKITVRTKDGGKLDAHVIGVDGATDLAVIKVGGAEHPFVSFEDRARPRVGDWVVAVGNPFGLGGTATAGIVSALGRQNVSNSSFVDYMQIDAPINRGNSGGPTFDTAGRVVGVNTAIFSPTGGSVGIGFDIPADVAASVTRQLIEGGKVVRGYIGATIQDVSPEIADSLGIAARQGALVSDVTPGGPSSQAGLRPGDLVQKVNDHAVSSASELTRQVAMARGGDTIRLEVRRDGAVREVDVRSGVRPTEASLTSGGGEDEGGGATEPGQVLGMQLQPNPNGGVTIAGLGAGSDAADKGLRPGDVILKAGTLAAATPNDVASAVAEAKRQGRKDVLLLVAHNGRKLFVPIAVPDDKS